MDFILNEKVELKNINIEELFLSLDNILEKSTLEVNDYKLKNIYSKILEYIKFWINYDEGIKNICNKNNLDYNNENYKHIKSCIKRLFIYYCYFRLYKLNKMKNLGYFKIEEQYLDIEKNYLIINIYRLLNIFYLNGRFNKGISRIDTVNLEYFNEEDIFKKIKLSDNDNIFIKNSNEYNILSEYLGLLIYSFSISIISYENRLKHLEKRYLEFLDFFKNFNLLISNKINKEKFKYEEIKKNYEKK